jgi:GDPmannose 4,6-dehydratase
VKSALIIGIGGQDGSYAAELLLGKGYRVVGASRPVVVDGRPRRFGEAEVTVLPLELGDDAAVARTIASAAPDEIYNFAAFSSGAAMFVDPVGIGDINGLAVARILEAIRQIDPAIRFCQASSSEVFGAASESPQSEATARRPRSPYGAAKLYADQMVAIYREQYGLFACSAIMFNHESPRRDERFVTRKVTVAAARIALGLQERLAIGNLEAVRDWGFAGDYVGATWSMLQAPTAADYVVATGVGHSVRDLCSAAFSAAGLDYRRHVEESAAAFRAAEAQPLIGDAAKARRDLDWQPTMDFETLVHAMVANDLANARAAMTQESVTR